MHFCFGCCWCCAAKRYSFRFALNSMLSSLQLLWWILWFYNLLQVRWTTAERKKKMRKKIEINWKILSHSAIANECIFLTSNSIWLRSHTHIHTIERMCPFECNGKTLRIDSITFEFVIKRYGKFHTCSHMCEHWTRKCFHMLPNHTCDAKKKTQNSDCARSNRCYTHWGFVGWLA